MGNPLLKDFGKMAIKNNPMMNAISNLGNPQSIMNMMMGNLQKTNPQGFNQLQQMMNNGSNPNEILNNLMSNKSPLEKEQMRQTLSQFGIPNEVLEKIK